MSKKAAGKTATKKRTAPPADRVQSPNITYTTRTVPRAQWERFAARLRADGRSIDWAINQFVSRVADGQFKFD